MARGWGRGRASCSSVPRGRRRPWKAKQAAPPHLPTPAGAPSVARTPGDPSYLKELVLERRGAGPGCFKTGLRHLTRAADSPNWASLLAQRWGSPKETCDTESCENRSASEARGGTSRPGLMRHEAVAMEAMEAAEAAKREACRTSGHAAPRPVTCLQAPPHLGNAGRRPDGARADETRPPAGRRQVKAPPRTHAKGKGPHLSERVLVGLVVPRVVVALDEREVLCLLSLERGRPAVGVGGKVALARETQAGRAVSAGSAGRRSRKPHTRGPHGRGPLHRVRVSSLARGACHTPCTEPAVQDPSPPPPRALSPAANALCRRRGPALTEPDRSSPSQPALFAPVVPRPALRRLAEAATAFLPPLRSERTVSKLRTAARLANEPCWDAAASVWPRHRLRAPPRGCGDTAARPALCGKAVRPREPRGPPAHGLLPPCLHTGLSPWVTRAAWVTAHGPAAGR